MQLLKSLKLRFLQIQVFPGLDLLSELVLPQTEGVASPDEEVRLHWAVIEQQ